MNGHTLSISIVTYKSCPMTLRKAVETLVTSTNAAQKKGILREAVLFLVDNDAGKDDAKALERLMAETWICEDAPWRTGRVFQSNRNLGYGQGNNLAARESTQDFHLVMNPDVFLESDTIGQAIQIMRDHPDVGMVSPTVFGYNVPHNHLCKRYPTIADLFLRGFMPVIVQEMFNKRLAHYELRDLVCENTVKDVPFASGCFMFLRLAPFLEVGGFSEEYFLYFEDFDLCSKLREKTRITFAPSVRITHLGGATSKKGLRHITRFCYSGVNFFKMYGWKWR